MFHLSTPNSNDEYYIATELMTKIIKSNESPPKVFLITHFEILLFSHQICLKDGKLDNLIYYQFHEQNRIRSKTYFRWESSPVA